MKDFIRENKMALIAAGIVILLIGVSAIVGFALSGKKDPEPETTKVMETTQETTTVPETTQEETTAKKNVYYSRLTGLKSSKTVSTARPVAIMFNNIVQAVPQHGIGQASIVYEAYVEGRITRLMGIYDDYQKIDSIGSIRSCREYYAHWASEYNAIYCHYGQSKYAVKFLNSGVLDLVNYNDSVGESAYYRTSDRVSPHNVFTNSDMLLSVFKQKKYDLTVKTDEKTHFTFAEPETAVSMKNAKTAAYVSVPYLTNQPYFKYNEKEKQYYRYQYDGKHIDGATGKQLTCKNIIIQFADFVLYGDGHSLDMSHIGKGTGYYISNGKAVEIKWSKPSETAQTVYQLADGSELVMNAGKTWISVFPTEDRADVVLK